MNVQTSTTALQSSEESNNLTNNSANVYSIACVQCRSRHKRCDKKLPSCSNCVKRGVECTYRSPKMKGRKDQRFHPYSSLIYIPPSTCTVVSNPTKNKNNNKNQQKQKEISNNNTTRPNQNNNNIYQQEQQLQIVNNNNLCPFDTNNIEINGMTIDNNFNIPYYFSKAGEYFNIDPSQFNINPLSFASPEINFQINLISNAIKDQRLNMNAYKRRTIELYEDVVSMGYPLLTQETLETAFFGEDSIRGIYNKDVLAFLYAIHAVTCQTITANDEALIAFNKARSLLSDYFDDSSNIFVAATYCFFSKFCSGIGEKGKAKFYLNYVDLFFKKKNVNFKTKRYLNYSIEEESKLNTNYSIFNGLNSDELYLMKYKILNGVGVDKSGEFQFNDCCNFVGFSFKTYVGKLLADGFLYVVGKIPKEIMQLFISKINFENLQTYLSILEIVSNFLISHETTRKASNVTRNIIACLYNLFYYGCKLLVYKEAGITGELFENEAHALTLATVAGPFEMVQTLTLGSLIETAFLHLQIIREFEENKRVSDHVTGKDFNFYYQMVVIDNRALGILASKFPDLIAKQCKPLVTAQEIVIARYKNSPLVTDTPISRLLTNEQTTNPLTDSTTICSRVQNEDKFNEAISVLLDELHKH
ncbi:hypothetical protein ABK040_007719 [Willaertia magna]